MDQLPWPGIGLGAGWAAFLTLALLQARVIARGDWIPRVTHERELEAVSHDANEWRAEGRIKDAQIAEKDRQLSHMGEVGRTVDAIMTALQQAASNGTAGSIRRTDDGET